MPPPLAAAQPHMQPPHSQLCRSARRSTRRSRVPTNHRFPQQAGAKQCTPYCVPGPGFAVFVVPAAREAGPLCRLRGLRGDRGCITEAIDVSGPAAGYLYQTLTSCFRRLSFPPVLTAYLSQRGPTEASNTRLRGSSSSIKESLTGTRAHAHVLSAYLTHSLSPSHPTPPSPAPPETRNLSFAEPNDL
jgi:hypothetical protein